MLSSMTQEFEVYRIDGNGQTVLRVSTEVAPLLRPPTIDTTWLRGMIATAMRRWLRHRRS